MMTDYAKLPKYHIFRDMTASFGDWFPRFQRDTVPSFSRVNRSMALFMHIFTHEYKSATFL